MAGFTLQELQQMGATPVQQPQPQVPQGFTLAELQSMGAKPVESPNLLQKAGGSIKDAFQSGVNQIKEGEQQGATATNPGTLLEGSLKIGAGAVNAAFSPLAPVFAPVGKAINAVADKVSDIPAVQKFATSKAGEVTSRVAEDVGNAATITQFAAGLKGAPEAVDTIKSALPESAPETPITPKSPEVQAQLKGVANDWAKPTTINNTSYAKARIALEKEPNTPQFLAEHGVNPFTHIVDGKYETEVTAQNLRDTAGKLSRETLRPSLQMADYTTPLTNIDDLAKTSIENAKGQSGVTAGDTKTISSNVQKEIEALKEKYPDGMSLTQMHDEKITYAQNAGYKPFADAAENNRAVANRAISNALGDMVEKKAPSDIPVNDFNQHLSKYYKAADYLDALNGKKAPVSFAQKVIRGVSGLVGAKIGSMIPGMGEIIGPVAGYKLANAFEYALENMTNPMRDTFLRNLKVTNPDAFAKVSEYIGKQAADAATRPLLKAGPALGTEGNPIITPNTQGTPNLNPQNPIGGMSQRLPLK